MTEYIVLALVAFGSSMLTFFSGFGLGTILMPTFVLFFPPEIAVMLTAIVHFLNNIFKIILVGRSIAYKVLLKFGIPAFIGAYLGAKLLFLLPGKENLFEGTVAGINITVNPLNLAIGVMMIIFSLYELVPRLKNFTFKDSMLIPGGGLSGFFGGLSGHQGALRSAFLVKTGLEKSAFIATGVAIACVVDVTRIAVYFDSLDLGAVQDNIWLLTVCVLSAFVGAFLGKRMLQKITIQSIQTLIGILMILLGITLIFGLMN